MTEDERGYKDAHKIFQDVLAIKSLTDFEKYLLELEWDKAWTLREIRDGIERLLNKLDD